MGTSFTANLIGHRTPPPQDDTISQLVPNIMIDAKYGLTQYYAFVCWQNSPYADQSLGEPSQSVSKCLKRACLDCFKGRVPAFVCEMVAILLTVRFPFTVVEAWDPNVISGHCT